MAALGGMTLGVLCRRCNVGCAYRVCFHLTGRTLSGHIIEGDAVIARLFVEAHRGPFVQVRAA